MIKLEDIKKRVKSKISEKRFIHTLGVAEEARRLAARWNADEDAAYLAGLVHDYAKELPIPLSIKLLESYGFNISDELLCCPALLHGPLGTHLIKDDFGITDADILNAVCYHSTGRPDMSVLEKIIYLADFIEPSRNFNGVESVRQLAYKNLNRAVLTESNMVIVFNVEKNVFLHSDTVKSRNYLLNQILSDN